MKRKELWEKLKLIQHASNTPWCCISDFNTILGAHEQKSRYRVHEATMKDFQDWTNSNNLIHIHTRGSSYTWSNGRSSRFHIQRRQDRAICNHERYAACNLVTCSTLTKLSSNHYPLLLEFKNDDCLFISQFKFLKIWISHPNCINIVKNCWNTQFIGCPMFILNQKLKHLKSTLKVWNKNTFGNVNDQVKQATLKVDSIQTQLDTFDITDDLLEQEKTAQIELEHALYLEETFCIKNLKLNGTLREIETQPIIIE